MQIDVLTLFPQMFAGPMDLSMMWKAQELGLLQLQLHDLRDRGEGRRRQVDDTPCGGGGGMILRADVLVRAIEDITAAAPQPVILLSPQGRVFSQQIACELAAQERMLLVCGHYEGVDERVRELVITDEISIGDYVLTGGELAAMVVIDAHGAPVARRARRGACGSAGQSRRRPAGRSALHASGCVSWSAGTRTAAQRRSRAHRDLAPAPVIAAHPATPT